MEIREDIELCFAGTNEYIRELHDIAEAAETMGLIALSLHLDSLANRIDSNQSEILEFIKGK